MAVQGAHRLPAFALYLLSVHARSLPHTFFHLFSFVFSFSPSAASLHPTFSYFTQMWARRYVFYSAASKWRGGGGDEKESLGVYVRACVYVCDAGEGCGVIGHARCLSVECSIGLELSLNMDEKESRGWCSRKIPPSVRLCLNNTKPLCFNTHSHTHAHTRHTAIALPSHTIRERERVKLREREQERETGADCGYGGEDALTLSPSRIRTWGKRLTGHIPWRQQSSYDQPAVGHRSPVQTLGVHGYLNQTSSTLQQNG